MLRKNIRILGSKLTYKKRKFYWGIPDLSRRKTTHTAKAEISGFGLPYLIVID
ncbi:hypothetical protein [Brevibacillus sp. VP]|uniref:hypothetical protein n=1 Tax=unclassified Brevibacillus TaxID=2684853 RepID=UPI001374A7A8|nr:hypothetical protein [Brevibacillus sp. VP]